MLRKIVSGGQTGVDRAALDAALETGFPCSGWCPKGRMAEDGPISPLYPLEETSSHKYPQRTEWNVRDSDATLILTQGPPTDGTALTIEFAKKWDKPILIVDFLEKFSLDQISKWIDRNEIRILNVAGPRGSKQPTLYAQAKELIFSIIERQS